MTDLSRGSFSGEESKSKLSQSSNTKYSRSPQLIRNSSQLSSFAPGAKKMKSPTRRAAKLNNVSELSKPHHLFVLTQELVAKREPFENFNSAVGGKQDDFFFGELLQ